MADEHKSQVEQRAQRIVQWLIDNRTEFEEQGVPEQQIASVIGTSGAEVAEVIDYLENREEVVRMPQGAQLPPQFLLKPGRGWPEMRDDLLSKGTGA
jgi:hypothetical protein